MADQSDIAQQITDFFTEAALEEHNNRSTLSPKNTCYNCGDSLENQRDLFCDSDCAMDHEKRAQLVMPSM